MTSQYVAETLVAAHRSQLEAEATASRRWSLFRRRHITPTPPTSAPLAAAPERTSAATVERIAA